MKYLVRLLAFLAALLLGITLLVGICTLGFYVAQATGNVYVIVSDGMQARAANILMPDDEDTADLTKFFTTQWIQSDAELTENSYVGDLITDFDERTKVESIWAKPWAGTATVTLVETVNTITGKHYTGEMDENGNAVTEAPAAWEKRRYKITCVKLGEQWLIDRLEVLEVMAPDPTPTKEPVITTPKTTGTPAVSPSPTPAA